MLDIKVVLLQCFTTYLIKKNSGGVVKSEIMLNQQLAEELHKPNIRKFEKRKVYSSYKDNTWSVGLADMQLIQFFIMRY